MQTSKTLFQLRGVQTNAIQWLIWKANLCQNVNLSQSTENQYQTIISDFNLISVTCEDL